MIRGTVRLSAVVGAGLFAVAGLSACGSGGGSNPSAGAGSSDAPSPAASSTASASSSPSASATAKPLQACSQVWVLGKRIPGGYTACTDHGTVVRPEVTRCESGQVLLRQRNAYYAAIGGRVQSAKGPAGAAAYLKALTGCRA